VFIPSHYDSEQNSNLITANKSFENVAHFKYLKKLMNQNCIHE